MIKIFFLVIVLSIASFARINPFEPTDTFIELKKQLISSAEENLTVNDEINATLKQPMPKIISVVDNSLKPQSNTKKPIVKKKKHISKCKDSYRYTPLKFVKIKLKDNSIKLIVDKKYKLLDTLVSDDKTKFVYDFQGRVTFYTIRKKFCSEYFKSFVLGTHLEDKFFRVVIQLKGKTSDYKSIIGKKYILIKHK